MNSQIHILGGGIIGLCTAYFLNKQGVDITVVDEGEFTQGASYGNAGMIVPSHFIPMAAPGVISQGLKWMLDKSSPFYIKPRVNLELFQWLYRFIQSSKESKVREAMPALLSFNELSKNLYKEMSLDLESDFEYQERGLLMLYNTVAQEKKEIDLVDKARLLGLEANIMNQAQLNELEPDMDIIARGGVYFKGDAHLSPHLLMGSLKKTLQNRGVNFIENFRVRKIELENNQLRTISNVEGVKIRIDQLVVAAGTWTSLLLRKSGIRMFLQDGKGYSLTLTDKLMKPGIPTILSEAKVALTPMGNDLRVGGTLEISGISPGVSAHRVKGITDSIPGYYSNLRIDHKDSMDTWFGFRPCTPDGLPYIGRIKSIHNLLVATGHGMMGLSLGAATGLLVSQLITGEDTTLDISMYDPGRFG